MAIDPKVLEYLGRMGSRAGRSPYTANTAAPTNPPPKYPYIDKALERLSKQRAARATGAATPPQPTFVNDTTIPKPAQPSRMGNFIRSQPTDKMGFLRRNINRAGRSGLGKAFIGGSLATTALDVANTPTEDYYKRFGITPEADSPFVDLMQDTGARALGAASDLGNNLSLGFFDRFFRDKPQQPGQSSIIPSVQAATGGGQPSAGGAQRKPAQPRSDYASRVDDPTFVPEQGTGVFRNERTGRTQTFDARGRQPVTIDQNSGSVIDEQQPVQIPNLALATDVDSLPAFLSQLTGAQQTIANQAAKRGAEGGFLKRVKEGQDIEKSELGLNKQRQLASVLEELNALDDQADPSGQERARLTKLALTLQGKSSTSTKGYQLANPATGQLDEFGNQQRELIRFNPETGQIEYIDQQEQADYTEEDLEFTAKQHGLTVEEVKKRLGIK
jgi:hypothetical protein